MRAKGICLLCLPLFEARVEWTQSLRTGSLLGLGRRGFLDLLDKEGIAYLDYSVEELEEEFRAVRELQADQEINCTSLANSAK